jgi:hypothetical protein
MWRRTLAAMSSLHKVDNLTYAAMEAGFTERFICLEVANAAEHSVEVQPNSESRMTANYSLG